MNAEPIVPDVVDIAVAERRARRAFERSMLGLGLARAAIVTAFVGALTAVGLAELPSVAWLAVVFVAWLWMGWRGSLVWRGAMGGLLAGLGALALPMSILRPCCATMTSATSCSMPQMCVAAGALLGLVVAATLPRVEKPGDWARASAGALVAVASLVSCRCASMFLGEAVGLLGGLLASAAGVAVARAWWSGRRVV
ncbi:MAG TPA: hypothetical protein VIF09_25955 [Polyangiaceae bacterium]